MTRARHKSYNPGQFFTSIVEQRPKVTPSITLSLLHCWLLELSAGERMAYGEETRRTITIKSSVQISQISNQPEVRISSRGHRTKECRTPLDPRPSPSSDDDEETDGARSGLDVLDGMWLFDREERLPFQDGGGPRRGFDRRQGGERGVTQARFYLGLPGDQSEDCIGVYKMPYMDAKDSFWINDKETLSIFAPDIRYVKTEDLPATLDLAKQQLFGEFLNFLASLSSSPLLNWARLCTDQRQQLKVVRNIVFDGDLRKAGVEVLRILPKVSSAGIKISEHIEAKTDFFDKESEKKFNTFDESMQGLLALWNGLDIEIGQLLPTLSGGQALRGQRGVTAVAQIEILADLKELTVVFDDFLRVVETYT
ncbi:hypothetical protein THAOC_24607 [Thalassiosira oceanica]|uniref:Uncharacterized protein n=1 Tax=Thalassiosira oceanica TaxID=159749 RepID=K0RRK1_THAOC|nr:hypothetical protein THAOC_24607 [Thalassiosira oceanica]|eukprot:EJK55640.1 hypothetical protein THAOC_24607 [Thalassiosira oceanica]